MGTDTALAVEKPSVLEQTIQVDEIQTRYLTAGDGPPLVLLHGAGDSARDWSCVLPLLGRSHQVLAPDLPGYSPGSVPADDYSPARLARFVARFWTPSGWTASPWPATPWAGWPPSSLPSQNRSGSPPCA